MTEAELRQLAQDLINLAADNEKTWDGYDGLGPVELMEAFQPLAEAWLEEHPEKKEREKS